MVWERDTSCELQLQESPGQQRAAVANLGASVSLRRHLSAFVLINDDEADIIEFTINHITTTVIALAETKYRQRKSFSSSLAPDSTRYARLYGDYCSPGEAGERRPRPVPSSFEIVLAASVLTCLCEDSVASVGVVVSQRKRLQAETARAI